MTQHHLTEHKEVVPKMRVLASDGSSLSSLEQEMCKRALILQREGRICAAECVAQGDGFAGVHEWFEEVWRKKSVMMKVEEFVRGKWGLVKMGLRYLFSSLRAGS